MVGYVLRVLVLCLVVGLLLAFFGISPASIIHDTWRTLGRIADLVGDVGHWALPYILTGAVIVIPIIVIGAVLRIMKGRRL
jgi:hypothetical protein